MEWLDWGLIAFAALYVFTFLLGRQRNQYLGKVVVGTVSAGLRPNFPIETIPFTYCSASSESRYQFKSVLSGHSTAGYAAISAELKPRHELLSLIINHWLYPTTDVSTLEIPLSGPPICFLIVRTDWITDMQKHFPDFVMSTQAGLKAAKWPGLREKYAVLGWKGSLQGKEQGLEELVLAASPALDFVYVTDKDPVSGKWPLTLRMSLTVDASRLHLLRNSATLALTLVSKLGS